MESGAVAGHQLLLIEPADSGDLVNTYEVKNNGNESQLATSKVNLELRGKLASSPVKGSNWTIVDIPQEGLFQSEVYSLSINASAIVALFALVAFALMFLLRREARQLDQTSEVISGIENDRQRIAMDMHDQVLSDLANLSRQCATMLSNVNDPKVIKSHLLTSEGALENVSNSIRTIIDDLHPQSLDILGLEDSLSAYIDKSFSSFSEPLISFSTNNFDEGCLNYEQCLNIYRITLEIIQNTVRHANATKCVINLSIANCRLLLVIEDNGDSFNPQNGDNALVRGIANVKTRSRIIGATVKWEAPVGFSQGTRFELEMSVGS